MTWVLAAATFLMWVVAGWKFRAMAADRARSPVIRDTAVCVLALAGVFTLLLPPVISVVDGFSANLALLLNSLLGIISITGFQSALVAGIRPGAVRRWWIACGLLDAVRAVLFIAAPARVHHVEMIDFAVNYTRYPVLTVYDALRLAWFTIIFGNIWRSCRALARREPHRSTRWGLRVFMYMGLMGLGYVGYEVAFLAGRFTGHPLPGSERAVGTAILSCIVLMIVASNGATRWEPVLSARLGCRRVRPLWDAVAASRAGGTLDDRALSPAQRLIRKRQEITDGLAQIAGHYDAECWRAAYQRARRTGSSHAKATAHADAATITDAFQAEQRGEPARPRADGDEVLSGTDPDDLSWQSAVSQALRTNARTPAPAGGARLAAARGGQASG